VAMDSEPASGFCFACHGPLIRLKRALGLRRGRSSDLARRCAAIVLLTWVPFMLLAAIGGLWRGQWAPLLFQIETHVRSLVRCR